MGTCVIDDCPRPVLIVSRQWCDAHYRRWRRHGDPRGGGPPKGGNVLTRFLSQTSPEGDCVMWTGSFVYGPRGVPYGRFKVNDRNVLAHRWIYEQRHGPITPGRVILHTCDESRCVNIDHLVAGTQADNIRDCVTKGRAWWQKDHG